MSSSEVLRVLLVGILLVGALGAAGPNVSSGLFENSHNGSGSYAAATDFPNSGGGITADAGGPYSVFENNSIQLDGTGSTISNGNIDSYNWTITSGNGSLSSNSGPQPTYNAPDDVQSDFDVIVQLEVDDGSGNTDTDSAVITVKDDDGGCGNTEIVFCTLTVTDTGSSSGYEVTYNVDDPSGSPSLDYVEFTLISTKNDKVEREFTRSSPSGTVTIAANGNMNGKNYRVRVAIYDTTPSQAKCEQTAPDLFDGNGQVGTSPCP